MKGGIKCPECKDNSLIIVDDNIFECLNCKKRFTYRYLMEEIEEEKVKI